MHLILVSRADPASVNIRDALLDMGGWDETGSFRGLPTRRHANGLLMAEIAPLHLEADLVDRELKAAGLAFDVVLVASKHKAESGKPALTVHPIGNLGPTAEFGGRPSSLVPTSPVVMGRVLRRLAGEAGGLKHEVTFEATHHGPYLETPTMFVEIGTDERAWSDPELGRRVARALLASVEPSVGDDAPALVMMGGSHYAPKATDLVKKARANFGHIVPAYALDRGVSPGVILDAIRGTPGCRGYFVDPRLVEKPPEEATHLFASLELGWWTEREL